METWRNIPGWNNYQASDLGNIKSLNSGEKMKLNENANGYLQVNLSKLGKRKTFRVHRLVMLAFVGKSSLEVNHKNGKRSDNKLENLEYCTRSENAQHKFRVLGYKNNFQNNHWNLGGTF